MDMETAARLFNCNQHLLRGWAFEQFLRNPMYALITAQVIRQERIKPAPWSSIHERSVDDRYPVFLQRQAD